MNIKILNNLVGKIIYFKEIKDICVITDFLPNHKYGGEIKTLIICDNNGFDFKLPVSVFKKQAVFIGEL